MYHRLCDFLSVPGCSSAMIQKEREREGAGARQPTVANASCSLCVGEMDRTIQKHRSCWGLGCYMGSPLVVECASLRVHTRNYTRRLPP